MKPRGRILKVKHGYNPNSSSIGTEITAFLWGAAVFSAAVNLLAAVVQSIAARRHSGKKRPT